MSWVSDRQHSEDLWDYLDTMEGMPSRADRDALVQKAAIEPEEAHRVQLWDYFFPVDPQQVGIPQKEEIKELQHFLETREEICSREVEKLIDPQIDRLKDLARTVEQLDNKIESARRAMDSSLQERQAQLRTKGCVLGAVGLPIFCIALFLLQFEAVSACGGTFLVAALSLFALASMVRGQMMRLQRSPKLDKTLVSSSRLRNTD